MLVFAAKIRPDAGFMRVLMLRVGIKPIDADFDAKAKFVIDF